MVFLIHTKLTFLRHMSQFYSDVYTHLDYNLLARDATYFGRKHSKVFGVISHNTAVLMPHTQESKISQSYKLTTLLLQQTQPFILHS